MFDHSTPLPVSPAPQGANVDQKGFGKDQTFGGTALFAAAQSGHRDAAALLLVHNAQVNAQNDPGDTPILVACKHGHESVVRELIHYGASAEQGNNAGDLPLEVAAAAGSEAVVRYLLTLTSRKKATKGTAEGKGMSQALNIARRSGHVSLANLLLNDMKKGVASRPSYTPPEANIYASNQQTHYAQQQTLLWLALKKPSSWKISMPPFNRPLAGMQLDPVHQNYIVPVFGLRIPKALMALFEMDGVRQLADELEIKLPSYTVSKAVQARTRVDKQLLASAHAAAHHVP